MALCKYNGSRTFICVIFAKCALPHFHLFYSTSSIQFLQTQIYRFKASHKLLLYWGTKWDTISLKAWQPTLIKASFRISGPRGLMPNPKSGTVTMEIGKAVKEVKQGKIDFKVDKFGIVHTSIGKVNFEAEKIMDNAREFMATIQKLKPSSAKGTYVKSVFLSSTMSPGIKLDLKSLLD